MKKKTGGNMPQTEQDKCPIPGVDTSPANAYPRCTDYDLVQGERRGSGGFIDEFMESCRPKEQTFTVRKPGNKVTEGRNY